MVVECVHKSPTAACSRCPLKFYVTFLSYLCYGLHHVISSLQDSLPYVLCIFFKSYMLYSIDLVLDDLEK